MEHEPNIFLRLVVVRICEKRFVQMIRLLHLSIFTRFIIDSGIVINKWERRAIRKIQKNFLLKHVTEHVTVYTNYNFHNSMNSRLYSKIEKFKKLIQMK